MNAYIPIRFMLVWGILYLPALAHAADERLALLLTGAACQQSHAALEQILLWVPGVRQIDFRAVPDHALIDVDTAVTDTNALTTLVNDFLAPQSFCHATIMKSCISADLRETGGRITRETFSIAQPGH